MHSSSREEVLNKIEYTASNLLRQLFERQNVVSLVLKADDDPASHEMKYSTKNTMKLARDMTVLTKVYELISTDGQATKRDLFYDDKNLYGNQTAADRSVTSICNLLDATRSELNITSCSRGLIQGCLTFISESGDSMVDCSSSPIPISDSLTSLRPLSRAQFILVVEKDATFQRMIDQDYFQFFRDSILVTGKGYPDICTRKVLNWLVNSLRIPLFGLFDADPHGMEIYLTYKYGTSKERVEARGAKVDKIIWLGIRRSDELHVPIPDDQKIPMVNSDYVKLRTLKGRAELLGEQDILKELCLYMRTADYIVYICENCPTQVEYLRKVGTKIELEAFTGGCGDAEFLNRCYLQPKINRMLEKIRMNKLQ